MKNVIFLISFCLLLIPALSHAGTAYYVDPTYNGSNGSSNGSFSRPWTTLAQANNRTGVGGNWQTGDDLYFRAGTVLLVPPNQHLNLSWEGSANNRVIIGAYYIAGGQPVVGLGGNSRPIIDGQDHAPRGLNTGMIHQFRQNSTGGYITVQDLHIKDSYAQGINLGARNYWTGGAPIRAVYNIVRNCVISNPGRNGIMWARSSYGLIENNTIYGTIHRPIGEMDNRLKHDGAAIEVTGMDREDVAVHNVIRGNTLYRNHETIGVYKGARYTTVEDNTIYDFARVGIYVANARDATINNNLIYEPDPSNSFHPSSGRRAAIWSDCEGHVANIIKVTGNLRITNNYIAGAAAGIWLQNNSNHIGVYQTNNKISGNRLIDNNVNIRINNAVSGWSGNEIYNNFSVIFTNGLVHTNVMSPAGVTWNGNYYNRPPNVTGNAAINQENNSISLVKKMGWRDLKPGTLSKKDFFPINLNGQSDVAPKAVTNFRIDSQ